MPSVVLAQAILAVFSMRLCANTSSACLVCAVDLRMSESSAVSCVCHSYSTFQNPLIGFLTMKSASVAYHTHLFFVRGATLSGTALADSEGLLFANLNI